MSIRTKLATLATTFALATFAHAGPIQFAAVTLDPTGVGAFPTGANAQQVCPVGLVGCLAGSPFSQPIPNEFTINMLQDGLFSASIIDSITPGGSGSFSVLSFELFNAALVSLGTGSLGTPLQDVALLAGAYTMRVAYTYTGLSDNSSASWSMTMTTAPRQEVPEPSMLALLGLILTVAAAAKRRAR